MFITIDLLKRFKACEDGLKYMERFYPDGVEMIDLIKDKHIPKEMLHWGRAHLTHSAEDLEAYCAACNIVNTEVFWYSEKVRDSKNVVKSKNVAASEGVFSSNDIKLSFDIVSSEFVENSKQIYSSNMIDNAKRILHCANVSDSVNICHSTAVARSKNVYRSQDVFDSSEIIDSSGVTGSHFCNKCSNITNCMFCFGLSDAEYHIFNKPVTKARFELFEQQYKRFMNSEFDIELNFIKGDWPECLVTGIVPTNTVFNVWYEPISDKFWKWVKTLPGYNAMALYNQTMLPRFILED